jgi:hypothetical protein
VLTLVTISLEGQLSWLGVGNVEATLLRKNDRGTLTREIAVTRGGVVGYQLPALIESHHSLQWGDLLVLTTDGIRDDFLRYLVPNDPPQSIAETLLDEASSRTDDALVLVARYVGNTP